MLSDSEIEGRLVDSFLDRPKLLIFLKKLDFFLRTDGGDSPSLGGVGRGGEIIEDRLGEEGSGDEVWGRRGEGRSAQALRRFSESGFESCRRLGDCPPLTSPELFIFLS